MRFSEEIISVQMLENLKNRIDMIMTVVNDINNIVSDNNSTILDLIAEIQNISDTIPPDVADIVRNLGTVYDFQNGFKDGLSGTKDNNNTTLLYELGYHVQNVIITDYYVSKSTGNDDNDGINQPFYHLTKALYEVRNSIKGNITITEAAGEVINDSYKIEDKIALNLKCDDATNPFTIEFVNLPLIQKSKLYINNIQSMTVDNIKFVNPELLSDNINFASPELLSNSTDNSYIMVIENSTIKFKNCIFEYTGTTPTIWIAAKNSIIILENCVFPVHNTESTFLTSLDNYPNTLIVRNVIYEPNTHLKDDNSPISTYGV